MAKKTTLKQFTSGNGYKIYRLPVQAFPKHFTNCYLILADNEVILIDAASGWDKANEDLINCFTEVQTIYNETVSLADITTLILTHGHIDHFGGIHFVKSQSPSVKIGIHELDARNIEHIDERIIMASKNLEIFLERAGLSKERVEQLSKMNKWSKDMFESTPIDFLIDPYADELLLGLFKVYHTPGHCPGQVCLQLDDILFTADHVLARTTPVQSPERITHYTGLGHYLEALRDIKQVSGVKLALGGHEDEMEDLLGRINETQQFHENRLEKILTISDRPHTVSDISKALFQNLSGYNVLLALLETGAHVEYLYQRGKIGITNLDEVEAEHNPVILYKTL